MSAAAGAQVTGAANVARYLEVMAQRSPDAPALHVARTGATTSFAALEAQVRHLAAGLVARGLRPGDRVLVMLRPGLPFVATSFALLSIGAVPVFADPGLGPRHLLGCIEATAPRGLIAVPALHAVRRLRPRPFRSVVVSISSGWWPGTISLSALAGGGAGGRAPAMTIAEVGRDDTAIIAFTTGSTGEPKGVCFSHRVLEAQLGAFKALTGIRDGDVQLAVLPLLAILGPGLGCATVLPDMDARRPGKADPRALTAAIDRYRITHAFASPAFFERLTAHCEATQIALPTLRRLLVGGAPVTPALIERLQRLLGGGGDVCVPYGATEAVPLTAATGEEVVAAARGATARGTLVGRALRGVEIRIAPIVDGAISVLDAGVAARAAGSGDVGEIIVRGDVVTPSYFGRPDAVALAKIPDPAGAWHRMGDLGRIDRDGRLWFCGRKSERIETEATTLYTTWVEPLFASDARVARAAVVGVGTRPRQRAVLIVEPAAGCFPILPAARRRLAAELQARAPRVLDAVLFRRSLPMDVRHNAKILRGELARWAERRLR